MIGRAWSPFGRMLGKTGWPWFGLGTYRRLAVTDG